MNILYINITYLKQKGKLKGTLVLHIFYIVNHQNYGILMAYFICQASENIQGTRKTDLLATVPNH